MATATNAVNTVWTARDELSATMAKIQGHTSSLEKAFGSLSARFKTGFVMGAGQAFFNFLDQSLHKLTALIPDLISKGEAWATTVHAISIGTKMTAEQSSVLASIWLDMTGSAEGLDLTLTMANKNIAAHATALHNGGITATNVLGALSQLRQVYQQTGASSNFAKLASDLLGRSWRAALPIMALTDSAWQKLTADAYASGRVMSQAQLDAATTWERTKNRLEGSITGLGAQILVGISPVLSGVIDQFTTFIQGHITQIVTFVSQAVTAVASFIGGLLGLNLDVQSMMSGLTEQTHATGDAYDKAVDKLNRLKKGTEGAKSSSDGYVKSLHAQLAALSRSSQAEQEREALQKTLHDLAQAKRDLRATQNEAYLSADMSNAAIVLAEQKHQADVKAAGAQVKSAQDAVRKQREQMAVERERNAIEERIAAAQQASTRATTANTAAYQKQLKLVQGWFTTGPGKTKGGPAGGVLGGVMGDITKQIADAKAFGLSIANALQDAIFGKLGQGRTNLLGDNAGGMTVGIRSGGLLDALSNLTSGIGGFLGTLSDINNWMKNTLHVDLFQVATALGLLKVAMGIGSPLLTLLGRIGGGTGTPPVGPPASSAPNGDVVTPAMGAVAYFNSADVLNLWHRYAAENGLDKPPSAPPGAPGSPYLGPPAPSRTPANDPNSLLVTFRRLFGDYFDTGSPLLNQQQDQQGILGALRQNTTSLTDGTLVTTLPDGTKVLSNVTDWNAGNMPTQIKNWLATQGVDVQNSGVPITNSNLANIGKVTAWPTAPLPTIVGNTVPVANDLWGTKFGRIGMIDGVNSGVTLPVGGSVGVNGPISGGITGPISGNIAGNVTGPISGNVAATTITGTAITGPLSGNVNGPVTHGVSGGVVGGVTGPMNVDSMSGSVKVAPDGNNPLHVKGVGDLPVHVGGKMSTLNVTTSGNATNPRIYGSGALFDTAGAHNMIVGEAGRETVAVLRNPRSGSAGGMGMSDSQFERLLSAIRETKSFQFAGAELRKLMSGERAVATSKAIV